MLGDELREKVKQHQKQQLDGLDVEWACLQIEGELVKAAESGEACHCVDLDKLKWWLAGEDPVNNGGSVVLDTDIKVEVANAIVRRFQDQHVNAHTSYDYIWFGWGSV